MLACKDFSTVEFLSDVDPPLCDKLKNYPNYLFYLADLYSKFNEQKRLQGKHLTIIQARAIQFGLFTSSMVCRDFQGFFLQI